MGGTKKTKQTKKQKKQKQNKRLESLCEGDGLLFSMNDIIQGFIQTGFVMATVVQKT